MERRESRDHPGRHPELAWSPGDIVFWGFFSTFEGVTVPGSIATAAHVVFLVLQIYCAVRVKAPS